MATRRKTGDDPSDSTSKRLRPATTPLAREQQLVSLAYDLAEKQMLEGTASSQVITQFLKLGSSREMIEQERLRKEVTLLDAKVEMMASAKRLEELYSGAIDAMRSYAGQEPESEDFDD